MPKQGIAVILVWIKQNKKMIDVFKTKRSIINQMNLIYKKFKIKCIKGGERKSHLNLEINIIQIKKDRDEKIDHKNIIIIF
jgi:hypothetical protein